jgi:hypothetical protein
MKKQPADSKKAAANDKENGNGKKDSKRTKPASDEKYTIGSIDTVSYGARGRSRRFLHHA